MPRFRMLALVVAATALLAVALRLSLHRAGRAVPGGVLIGDTAMYDRITHLVMGGLFRGIAADVAAVAPTPARVLEVGCGPGRLAIELARSHGLEVTGLDLDPAMIDRARVNAASSMSGDEAPVPTFVVGDVAALPFDDGAFDLVVSTFSMHHWSDPEAGLHEIARVLRPGGRALVWDLKAGMVPIHPPLHVVEHRASGSPLGPGTIAPWRWPGRLTLSQRAEFVRE